jgi:hypothetical protein
MSGPTSAPKDWFQYFQSEAKRSKYGTFDKFNDEPSKYVGNADEFKARIANNDLKTIIVIPGADKTVQLLHNCTIDEETNKLMGYSE